MLRCIPSGTVSLYDALSVGLAFSSLDCSTVGGLELHSLPLSDVREEVVPVSDRLYKERLLPKSERAVGGYRGLEALLQAQRAASGTDIHSCLSSSSLSLFSHSVFVSGLTSMSA